MSAHLASLYLQLAQIYAELAAELDLEASPAPAANDTKKKRRGVPRHPGPRTVPLERLKELGFTDTDKAAADRLAKKRGISRGGS